MLFHTFFFGGTSTSGNHDPTSLAYSSLVATTVENVNCNPISLAEAGGPTFTITLSSNTTPLKEEIDYAGMSPVWQSIQDRGISEAAAKLIMASWRDGTKKQYSTYITKWQKFCNQRQISHIQPSVVSGQRGQTVHLLSIDHMVSVNNCYTFQIVDHLKQKPSCRTQTFQG